MGINPQTHRQWEITSSWAGMNTVHSRWFPFLSLEGRLYGFNYQELLHFSTFSKAKTPFCCPESLEAHFLYYAFCGTKRIWTCTCHYFQEEQAMPAAENSCLGTLAGLVSERWGVFAFKKDRSLPDPETISVPQGAGEMAFSFISNNKVGRFHCPALQHK